MVLLVQKCSTLYALTLTQGLMLHYRSKRRGFTTYTAGQLKAVATTYFKTEMGIEVKESEIKFDTVHVSFQVGRKIYIVT